MVCKRLKLLMPLLAAALLLFSGCGQEADADGLSGTLGFGGLLLSGHTQQIVEGYLTEKTFVYEGGVRTGPIMIKLRSDGFSYWVGGISGYLGHGDWELDADALTLRESGGKRSVFNFRVEDGELVFVAEDSDRFCYTDVPDGWSFLPCDYAQSVPGGVSLSNNILPH